MAPSKSGGRPKNAWNSSRRRKLVRLYTLTTLSKDEIRQVLKAHDFNPCSRDIQNKLKDLFPRDYTKENRQYRPKNASSATVRLKRLQQNCQARKSRASMAPVSEQAHFTKPSKTAPPHRDASQAFEGPLSAFRNYAGIYNPSANWPQLSLSGNPSESKLVVPSLLLLDGSSIAGTAVIRRGEYQPEEVPSSAPAAYQTSSNHSISAPSPGQSQPVSRQSSMISLRSLEARLARRSNSLIQHVQSVLRYSSTNSWRSSNSCRSSWLSFVSQASEESAISLATSCSRENATTSSSEGNDAPSEDTLRHLTTKPLKTSRNGLSKTSIITSDEPLDDTSKLLYPRYLGRSSQYVMAYEVSGCYNQSHTDITLCKDCGMQSIHSYVYRIGGVDLIRETLIDQINEKDFCDNGTLHFAARSKSRDSDHLIRLIEMGADFRSVNTFGANFLHILFSYLDPKDLLEFLPLLRHLAVLGFSFSSRDYHGRQPFHRILERTYSLGLDSLSKLEQALAIANPDIDALDNRGRCIRRSLSQRTIIKSSAGELLSRYPTSPNISVNFRTTISEMNYDLVAWIKWLAVNDRSVWIDGDGNTALIALLKYWSHDQDELLLEKIIKQMVTLGTQIHMRDRKGRTALAIAARRGLRPAVKTLIELGASIHTKDDRKNGILSLMGKSMHRVKHSGDDKLHAMIWSCSIYLHDLKACELPTLRRELWAAWAPDSHFRWGSGEVYEQGVYQSLKDSGLL